MFESQQSDNGKTMDQKAVAEAPPPPSPTLSASDLMRAMGTSPRRIVLSGISATGIALAGNLFGVTSGLLAKFPEETVEATGLDTYFPVGDYKRIRTPDYTLVIPKEWVADAAVEMAKAQRRSRSLDYSKGSRNRAAGATTLPDAAFGPPGNRLMDNRSAAAADTNVSVISTPTPPNFRLRQIMGEASVGAQFLLDKFLAPAGSGRTATLLSVSESTSLMADQTLYYRFAYTIDRGERGVPLQSISIVAQQGTKSEFVCFTVVAPRETWETDFRAKLDKIADSFRLVARE